MDIAYYLSELLEQLGEVNVPGLGSFTRVKVDGYYNDGEGRFYPPASKIEFNQHYIDDDVLARYIGVKKRISLASSKYFTEKYLNGLRQEIMSKAITLADIGLLYFENGAIHFKAAEAMPDPAFFGYPQIVLNKLGNEPVITDTIPVAEPEREPGPEVEEEIEQQPIEEYVAPVIHNEQQAAETHEDAVFENTISHFEEHGDGQESHGFDEAIIAEETITRTEEHEALHDGGQEHGIDEQQGHFVPEAVENDTHTNEDDDFIFHSVTHDEVEEEEEPGRSYKWIWITLVIIAVAGGGIYGWFYYQQMQQPTVVKKIAPVTEKDTLDTLKNAATADTNKKTIVTLPVQNTPASTIDSTKRRYEIIATEAKDIKEATVRIGNYQSLGYTAHVVNDAPGRRLKISLGTYADKAEAILNQKKIKKVKDTWLLTINPKK